MEARSFSQEKSQQLMRKVKEYKADLKKITEDSKAAQGASSGDTPQAHHTCLSLDMCTLTSTEQLSYMLNTGAPSMSPSTSASSRQSSYCYLSFAHQFTRQI